MRKYATALLHRLIVFLEFFISFLLAAIILLLALKLVTYIPNIPNEKIYPNYNDFLETCLNLVIGVELIHMLYQHSPHTVFEVLLFAIARQIIVDHSNPITCLIGVIAIAILFATRKFLFIEFDESEKIIFRSTTKVRSVNRIIHVQIPYEDEQTLGGILLSRLAQEKLEVGVGACVYFDDFGLRVAKMHNGEISRVEVIRSIT